MELRTRPLPKFRCTAFSSAPPGNQDRSTEIEPVCDELMSGHETDLTLATARWLVDQQLLGIVVVDGNGIVVDCQGGLVDWVGIGQQSADCLPFLNCHEDALERVAQGQCASLFLSGFSHPRMRRGMQRLVSVQCIRRAAGAQGLTLIFQDTTALGVPDISGDQQRSDLKLAERRMAQAQESANLAKSLFLATVSHELRTPLNVIIGNAEILRDWDPGSFSAEDLHTFAEDILDNGTFLLDHINDLLDLARAEVGGIELEENEIDIRTVVDGTVAAVQKLPHAGTLTIQHEPDRRLPQLLGDPQRLRQIVLNLLVDAVRIAPNGGSILVRTFVAADDALTVEISNSATENAPASASDLLQTSGTGNISADGPAQSESALGLPLAKTLIELHGGTLAVSGAPGEPTKLTLRFPPNRTQALA